MRGHMDIPLARPSFDDSEIEAVAEVIRSGWVTQGARVAAFEQAVAEYVGARHAVATTSCTTAMDLALRLHGIGAGDGVIMPSFTCPATANAVCHAGALPQFAEIDPRTFNLEPQAVADAVTPRSRAVMVVHQFGLPAPVDEIAEVARRRGLVVVEDAGVALGAAYNGRPVGGLGAPTCFSFHGRKVVTTGEGGMLTTDDDDLAARARVVRSHGASLSDVARHQARGTLRQAYEELGYNLRLTDLQAAVGVVQMRKLPRLLERRRVLAERYGRLLAELPEVEPPWVPAYAVHSYQSYVVRPTGRCRAARDDILAGMAARGVSCRHTLACHTEPAFQRLCGRARLPVTEMVAAGAICLPLYPEMTDEEQGYVVDCLKEAVAPGAGMPR